MRRLAPAKINLHLRVGPPREDGFHPLLTWMCTVGLFDELEFSTAGDRAVELTCDDPAIPTGAENLIVRAAMALADRPAKIKLIKRIPMGGGLAGGSSNAATTLLALNELWQMSRSPQELAIIASKLGSDIPFFFFGPSSICTGLGEVVRPLPRPKAQFAHLIFPPYGMPTPKVYRRFDEMKLGDRRDIEQSPDFEAWTTMSSLELLSKLVNDLEMPAFDLNPQLAKLRHEWEQRLQRPIRMSGSGSTLFTLYDDEQEALSATFFFREASARLVKISPATADAASPH
jgi:4-diphosphocytidyl-2-C-methyl-D-erythritol kinase